MILVFAPFRGIHRLYAVYAFAVESLIAVDMCMYKTLAGQYLDRYK